MVKRMGNIKTPLAEIIVNGTVEKPCYHIMYLDPTDKCFHVGFGSFNIEYVRQWLAEEFEVIEKPVDMVEVVRCKDCRAYLPPTKSRDWGICRRHTTPMRDDNFCNYGEKEV